MSFGECEQYIMGQVGVMRFSILSIFVRLDSGVFIAMPTKTFH